MKYFYEKNTELLESPVNITFDKALVMNPISFRRWVIDLRKTVVDLWDNKGIPPRVGYDEEEIIDNFRRMVGFPVHELEISPNVIRNTSVIGNAVNQWFPTMMKTKISYTSHLGKSRSIYDYFANDDLLDTFVTYANRHFKRDSFYHYSSPISVGDQLTINGSVHVVTTAEEFRDWFAVHGEGYGYWLCGVKTNKKYTGFNTNLNKKQNLLVDADFVCPKECRTNVDERWTTYNIRLFKRGQKLFPVGLKAFRVSFCQYAVNFPPLTARYLYERYTRHIEGNSTITIYDPSMGWGGRLLGLLSSDNHRNYHYVGTDPNTDHNLGDGRTKYHDFAEFFNENVRNNGTLFPKSHTYDIFQQGSEVIRSDPDFQKYKGKVDFIFTSPPYFSKEVYSDDPEQSCHKFDDYTSWRDGFLRPTLETCVEWLAPNRYLAWNVADPAVDGKLLPLEEDSCEILKSLGMEYVETIKMTLAQMPGGNRLVDTGETETVITNTVFGQEVEERPVYKGMMKNFVTIQDKKGKDMVLKFEPVYIFKKP